MTVNVQPPDDAAYRRELLRFVESFALILSEAGWPRMAARVFAYALADDADRYTAAELAEGLQVSPAAISGAVRFLVSSGMLAKEREPGSRADSYTLDTDDMWKAIFDQRAPLLDRWRIGLIRGIELLGTDRPGGRRLAESLAFFEFLQQELPGFAARWRAYRAANLDEVATARNIQP